MGRHLAESAMSELNVEAVSIAPGTLHPDRRSVIGGSDIAAIVGESAYKTALDVALEKTGRFTTIMTPIMERGLLFEPVFPGYLAREYPGYRIHKANAFLVDRQRRSGCHPDYLMEDPVEPGVINVQCKVIGRRNWELGGGKPHFDHELQTLWEGMHLAAYLGQDYRFGLLAYLVIDQNDTVLELSRPIERHAEAEGKLLEAADQFWAIIDAGKLPAADYRRDSDAVRLIYPPDKAVPVPLDLTGDNRLPGLLEQREKAKATERAAVAESKAIDVEIVEKLKGAELALADGWKITRKMTHHAERLQAAYDYPDMRITRIKEKA